MQYGIAFYPVTIVLDEAIVTELKIKEQIICTTQAEFENTLANILNSKKVEKVVRGIIK